MASEQTVRWGLVSVLEKEDCACVVFYAGAVTGETKPVSIRRTSEPFHFSGWFLSFLINIYLFIFLVALGLSCGRRAPRLRLSGSLVAAHGLLSCGMHVGSSSPTRDRTQAPCIGSAESHPLRHKGSPSGWFQRELCCEVDSLNWNTSMTSARLPF